MLKRKINKEAFNALPEVLQGVYEADGDDYVLQAEGEDVTALKSAKDHEKTARQAAEKELRDMRDAEAAKIKKAEEAARAEALKEARENNDIAALEKSWKDKYKALEATKDAEIKTLNDAVHSERVQATANAIATDISTVPDLLQSRIESRLTVEMVDGKFTTRVLDAEGQPSAMSVEELQTEFANNPSYKGIIKAGKASGGGANNSNGGSASDKPFDKMTSSERVALKKSNPERFSELAEESRQGTLNPM